MRLNDQLMRMYEDVVPGTLFDPIVPATIRFLVGPTIADWLRIPRSPWDTAAKAVPVLLGVLETIEDSSRWASGPSTRRAASSPPSSWAPSPAAGSCSTRSRRN